VVAAREDGQVALYLVDAADAGVHAEPLRSIGRTPVCNVRYQEVAAERIADAGALESLVRLGRALASVQCVGAMQQALDM